MPTDTLPRPWRPRGLERGVGWLTGAALIALAALLPLGALAWEALHANLSHWTHLASYVLPPALATPAMLLARVRILVTCLGTGPACLATAYGCPSGRRLSWALLLPLAVPVYIIGFGYLHRLPPLGPLQTASRELLGYDSPRPFRLPGLRWIYGAIFV